MINDVTAGDDSECSNTYCPNISYPAHNPEAGYEQEEQFFGDQIKELRMKYPQNVVISYLNINLILNKFENFTSIIEKHVDVLVIAETKLDGTFENHQFKIPAFKQPYRLDVSSSSGGLLVYINDQIPSRLLIGIDIPCDIQVLPIEMNLKKTKWLLLPAYRPPSQDDKYFICNLERKIDFHTKSIGNMLIFGDLNMDASEPAMKSLLQQYSLFSMIRSPTCFKSPQGKCIYLMLTNSKHSFFGSQTFET